MTKPKLKLVAGAVPAPLARPFETVYFTSTDARASEWCAKGHAASARGAIRAAFTRILDRRANAAWVHNEAGVVVARLWRERRGIQVVGSAVLAREAT